MPKYMESDPMIKKRFKAINNFLKEEYGDILDTNICKLGIVTHAGVVKRYFNTNTAKNGVAVVYDKTV